MNLKENVERGVALLDAEKPGWDAQIDLENFDFSDTELCILGQLYAGDPDISGFDVGLVQLFGEDVDLSEESAKHGFDVLWEFGMKTSEHYSELHELWKAEILSRRAPDDAAELDTPIYNSLSE